MMSQNRLLLRHFRATRLTCNVFRVEVSHNYVSNRLSRIGGFGTHLRAFASTDLLIY